MTESYWPQDPPPRPARELDYDWECEKCFAQWNREPRCPVCGKLAISEGDRVQDEDGDAGTVTAIYQDRVTVKFDAGLAFPVAIDRLRQEDA